MPEERPDAAYHIGGGICVADNVLGRESGFLDPGRCGSEPPQAGAPMRDDGLKGLVEFVSNGGGQFGDRREP